MDNVYLGELLYDNCKNQEDVEGVVIRLHRLGEVIDMTFDEFLKVEGEIYFRNLAHYYNYLFKSLTQRRMKINPKRKIRKLKINEFQFARIVTTNNIMVYSFKTCNNMSYSLKNLYATKWEEDLQEFMPTFLQGYAEGLKGASYSSAGKNRQIEIIFGKGKHKFKNYFNDSLLVKEDRDAVLYPVLDESYQGKTGKIGISTLGALNIAAESKPFEYTGESTTIDMNSMYSSLKKGKAIPYGRPRIVDFNHYKVYRTLPNLVHLLRFRVTKATPRGLNWKGVRSRFSDEVEYHNIIENQTFTMWDEEFILMIEDYEIEGLEVEEIMCFRAVVGLFDKAIDVMYELKKKSLAYKLMLNGSDGKISQNPEFRMRLDVPDYQVEELDPEEIDIYEVDQTSTSVAYFSYLLSCARVQLVRTINKIGIERFLYSDTDSITFKGKEPDWLNVGEGLGQWKVESRNTYFKYIQPKTYMKSTEEGDEFRVAGLSTEARDQLTRDNFKLGKRLIDKVWNVSGVIPKLEDKIFYIGGKEIMGEVERRYKQALKVGEEVAEKWRLQYCPWYDGAEI